MIQPLLHTVFWEYSGYSMVFGYIFHGRPYSNVATKVLHTETCKDYKKQRFCVYFTLVLETDSKRNPQHIWHIQHNWHTKINQNQTVCFQIQYISWLFIIRLQCVWYYERPQSICSKNLLKINITPRVLTNIISFIRYISIHNNRAFGNSRLSLHDEHQSFVNQ